MAFFVCLFEMCVINGAGGTFGCLIVCTCSFILCLYVHVQGESIRGPPGPLGPPGPPGIPVSRGGESGSAGEVVVLLYFRVFSFF